MAGVRKRTPREVFDEAMADADRLLAFACCPWRARPHSPPTSIDLTVPTNSSRWGCLWSRASWRGSSSTRYDPSTTTGRLEDR